MTEVWEPYPKKIRDQTGEPLEVDTLYGFPEPFLLPLNDGGFWCYRQLSPSVWAYGSDVYDGSQIDEALLVSTIGSATLITEYDLDATPFTWDVNELGTLFYIDSDEPELHSIDVNGNQSVVIADLDTYADGGMVDFAFDPQTQKWYWITATDLWVSEADWSDPTNLTDPDGPEWYGDGALLRIVCCLGNNSNQGVWVGTSEGNVCLYRPGQTTPAFVPDGADLARCGRVEYADGGGLWDTFELKHYLPSWDGIVVDTVDYSSEAPFANENAFKWSNPVGSRWYSSHNAGSPTFFEFRIPGVVVGVSGWVLNRLAIASGGGSPEQ